MRYLTFILLFLSFQSFSQRLTLTDVLDTQARDTMLIKGKNKLVVWADTIAVYNHNGITAPILINFDSYVITTRGAGNYAILSGDQFIKVTAVSGGGDTYTLPSGLEIGKTYIIKDAGAGFSANMITLDTAGSALIDGETTYNLTVTDMSVTIIFDGTDFWIN